VALATPSAASNSPLAWRTSRCGRELDRAIRSSSARCSAVISSGLAGRLAIAGRLDHIARQMVDTTLGTSGSHRGAAEIGGKNELAPRHFCIMVQGRSHRQRSAESDGFDPSDGSSM
jgi:hypothetical protein